MSVAIGATAAAEFRFEDRAPARLANLPPAVLYETALRRDEGMAAAEGPLVVRTGEHTGRSAQDKFVVRRPETEKEVWWDNNKPMALDAFHRLKTDMLEHAQGLELFSQAKNREWQAKRLANTPLGLYLGVDFALQSVQMAPDEPWAGRLQRGEIKRPDLQQAMRQFNNVIAETTTVLRAVKPAGG